MPGRIVRGCFEFQSHFAYPYVVQFHVDNRFRSWDALEKLQGTSTSASAHARDLNQRHREIELVCTAQASISGFPQGDVRAYVPDPPDVLVVPNPRPNQPDNGGVGIEVSELIDQDQHEKYARAKKVAYLAASQWAKQGSHRKLPVRLLYGITPELIACLESRSRHQSVVAAARDTIECSVQEFLNPSHATGRYSSSQGDSGCLRSVSETPHARMSAREVIHVQVSASTSGELERDYMNPVSTLNYRDGRLYSRFEDDVTLDARRLQEIVARKAAKVQQNLSGTPPMSSLVLYLTAEYFPKGHSETGSLGILHVNDCHPDRSYQYDIDPFSHVYINCESHHYVINAASQYFVQQCDSVESHCYD